jgi:hypothetical protein
MAFDPKRHVIKVQGGREYLPVSARLVWFRHDHPDWGIVTSPVEINMEKQYAIFSAQIFNAEGKLMATATKMENVRGFPDYIEKAETGSVGRALAYCGYGTQFAPELEEGSRMADAPYGGNRFASGNAPARSNGGGYGGNGGNGGNGGMNRMPSAPPATRPMNAPAPPPPPQEDDSPFDDEPAPAPPAPRAAAPRPAAPANRPAPENNGGGNSGNSGNGGGITRVREPERQYADPGGDEDDEDPFAEEDEAPAPVAAPSRPAATRASAPAAAPAASAPAAGDKTRCSVEGCPATLLPGQVTMSMAKFGKPLCVVHQKGAAPELAGVSPASSGGSRRSAKNDNGGGDTLL